MATVTQLLTNALSQNAEVRQGAERELEQLSQSNPAEFLNALSAELADAAKPAMNRELAGISIKNALYAKSQAMWDQKKQVWLQVIPQEVKGEVRSRTLRTLQDSDRQARRAAAQAVASIAYIDLPNNQWTELISQLCQAITETSASNDLKEASLSTIGYICEELSGASVLEAKANELLTAIVHGMRPEEQSSEIRLAAARALLAATDFVSDAMSRDVERNFIMTCVCQATQAPNEQIREVAYQILVKVVSTYYEYMNEEYMKNIFEITTTCLKKGEDDEEEDVQKQALEVWSSLCEHETELMAQQEELDAFDDEDDEEQVSVQNHFFAKAAAGGLCPILCQALTRQEEEQDENDWNVSTAAGVTLNLMAQVCKNDIVQYVFPFIEQYIGMSDPSKWRSLEAATLAFGSILDGPDPEFLRVIVEQAVPIMLSHFQHPNILVQDTTVWTIGRIADLHSNVVKEKFWLQVTEALAQALMMPARVAAHACWGIQNLAKSVEDEDENTPADFPGLPFGPVVQALLQTSDRSDGDESQLRTAAYEALNTVVETARDEQATPEIIEQLVQEVIVRIERCMSNEALNIAQKEEQQNILACLCGILQSLVVRLGERGAQHGHFDKFMELVLKLLQSPLASSTTLMQECIMTAAAIADVLEGNFERYLLHFAPFLLHALENVAEYDVCSVAISCAGRVITAMGEKILPFADDFVRILLTNLQKPEYDLSLKGITLSTFGDMALALGGRNFMKYMQYVMQMISEAMKVPIPDEESDADPEEVCELRKSICETLSGILQGFKDLEPAQDRIQLLGPYVEGSLEFVADTMSKFNDIKLMVSSEVVDELFGCIAGLAGDIADVVGSVAKEAYQRRPPIKQFLQKMGRQRRWDSDIRSKAKWAVQVITRVSK